MDLVSSNSKVLVARCLQGRGICRKSLFGHVPDAGASCSFVVLKRFVRLTKKAILPNSTLPRFIANSDMTAWISRALVVQYLLFRSTRLLAVKNGGRIFSLPFFLLPFFFFCPLGPLVLWSPLWSRGPLVPWSLGLLVSWTETARSGAAEPYNPKPYNPKTLNPITL